jgi:hypothetical protein
MNFSEILADLKAKAESALGALAAFNDAHPDFAAVEVDALNASVNDLAGAAKNVAESAPADAQPSIDDAIAVVQTQLNDEIAAAHAKHDAALQGLTAAKAAVATAHG